MQRHLLKRLQDPICALFNQRRSNNKIFSCCIDNAKDWFVNEQLEEVSTMGALLSLVRRAGESGLLHVEEYLAREGLGEHEAEGG